MQVHWFFASYALGKSPSLSRAIEFNSFEFVSFSFLWIYDFWHANNLSIFFSHLSLYVSASSFPCWSIIIRGNKHAIFVRRASWWKMFPFFTFSVFRLMIIFLFDEASLKAYNAEQLWSGAPRYGVLVQFMKQFPFFLFCPATELLIHEFLAGVFCPLDCNDKWPDLRL